MAAELDSVVDAVAADGEWLEVGPPEGRNVEFQSRTRLPSSSSVWKVGT